MLHNSFIKKANINSSRPRNYYLNAQRSRVQKVPIDFREKDYCYTM